MTLCPHTVRACIDALPKDHGMARTEAWENGLQWHRATSRKALYELYAKANDRTTTRMKALGQIRKENGL